MINGELMLAKDLVTYSRQVMDFQNRLKWQTNLEKSGASLTRGAELDLTLLLVAKLNSTGLVRVGLGRGCPDPDRRPDDCLEKAEDDVSEFPFFASLDLMESRSIIFLATFWPWFSLALYLLITSGVRDMAAEVLVVYLVTSGVLALLVRARPSLGASVLVPSLLGVSLASRGLFRAFSMAASTWAFRAARRGVITRGTAGRDPPLTKHTSVRKSKEFALRNQRKIL